MTTPLRYLVTAGMHLDCRHCEHKGTGISAKNAMEHGLLIHEFSIQQRSGGRAKAGDSNPLSDVARRGGGGVRPQAVPILRSLPVVPLGKVPLDLQTDFPRSARS